MKSRKTNGFFSMWRSLVVTAGASLFLLLAGCNQAAPRAAVPIEPNSETASAVDGMILNHYPGPKAQIHYAEGKPEFFSDLIEMFTMVLVPEQKRPIVGIFVQDMGHTSWEHPVGHWIDAKTAVYVVGSTKMGSMGATFGSFSSTQDAAIFAQKEGGDILRFEQITAGKLKQPSVATMLH